MCGGPSGLGARCDMGTGETERQRCHINLHMYTRLTSLVSRYIRDRRNLRTAVPEDATRSTRACVEATAAPEESQNPRKDPTDDSPLIWAIAAE